jgi:hypothetical protein
LGLTTEAETDGKETKSSLLARQHASTPQVAREQLVRYSIGVRKAEPVDFLESSLFSGGGASKPHRSKYIVVVNRIVQLHYLWLHPFFFSTVLINL